MSEPGVCSFVGDDFLKRFRVISKLGEGTYGSVYLIRSMDGKQEYALKAEQTNTRLFDLGVPSSFLLDADSLIRLRPVPDVINLIGICYMEGYINSKMRGYVYIIMEAMDSNLLDYYRGVNTENRIKLAMDLLTTLVRAASVFEEINMNHFDIKPQNILVRNTDPPKFVVTDFGISRPTFSKYYIRGEEVFTRWYRPPEFLADRSRTTFDIYKGDVWSIAVTVAEFILGTPIFPGDSVMDMLIRIHRTSVSNVSFADFYEANNNGKITGYVNIEQILHANLSDIYFSQINPQIISILTKMLSLNPDNRPTASTIFNELGKTIDPAFIQSLKPPIYVRSIFKNNFDIIIELGEHLALSRPTIIIALEIITRYLGMMRATPGKNNIHTLAALRVANKFNEVPSDETNSFVEAYNRYFVNPRRVESTIRISDKDLMEAEKDLLHQINFHVYNINLTPAIDRSFTLNILPENVPLIEYTKPVSQWFGGA